MSENITKKLNWYQKHESFRTVTVNYIVTVEGIGVFGKDETILESELEAIAKTAGKTTWDEEDICSRLDLQRGND